MIVTLKAVIHDGKVELAEPATLPEGAKVLVTVLPDDGTDFWSDASQKSLGHQLRSEDDGEIGTKKGTRYVLRWH